MNGRKGLWPICLDFPTLRTAGRLREEENGLGIGTESLILPSSEFQENSDR